MNKSSHERKEQQHVSINLSPYYLCSAVLGIHTSSLTEAHFLYRGRWMLILPHNSSTIWYLLYQINFHNLRIIFQDNFRKIEERRSRTQDRRMKILIQEITPKRITDVTAHKTITTTKSRNYCKRNHQTNETLLQILPKYSKQTTYDNHNEELSTEGTTIHNTSIKDRTQNSTLEHHRNNIHGCDRVIFHPTQSN